MTPVDVAMKERCAARPEAVALACLDTRSGLVLDLEMRDDADRDEIEMAALAPESPNDDGALVASTRWVQAHAHVPERDDLVVAGLAPAHASLALLRAWIRRIAERVGPRA